MTYHLQIIPFSETSCVRNIYIKHTGEKDHNIEEGRQTDTGHWWEVTV